ncbi:MAG TPA: rod shape-determining protein MreC [Actinomycetota bacterium]|nr:rod shape-determining protein MreC [Actinomycetota bacterium]
MYQHSRRRQLTVLAALLAASIVCITIDFRQPDGGPVDRLQRLAIAVFGPLQRGAGTVVRPVAGLAGEVAELGGLRDHNRRLEAEVARLRAQERTYADVLGENRRLRGALGMARRCGCRTVGASVVASSGSNFQLSVTVDAGSRQGVARDMAVVDADGLVGRVTQVTAGYATVLLVTDPSSGVAATLAPGPEPGKRGNKAPGVVRGTGTQLLSFQPVRAGTPVRRGDPVLTQAYQGGVFPAGLPIGVVEQVDPAGAAPLVPRVTVRPYAALATLDVVAVVVDRPAPPKRGT